MLSSSQDALLKLSKTLYPQKLFPSDISKTFKEEEKTYWAGVGTIFGAEILYESLCLFVRLYASKS